MQVGLLLCSGTAFSPRRCAGPQLGAGSVYALQGPGDVSKVTFKSCNVIRIV
jgi:hypothetical protein